jgi:hypothetical protein
MKASLPALPHCKGNSLANFSQYARHEKFHLPWVPHAMDAKQKAERVTLSHGILSLIQSVRSPDFQSVITGDELLFVLSYPRDSTWASSRDEVSERVSQKMNMEKWLISLF